MPAMRAIATWNTKGGVGKTTTAVSVAAALAATGRRVGLVDLDPQANASTWLGVGRRDGLLDVLADDGDLGSLVVHTEAGIDVVPASTALTRAERVLDASTGAGALRDALARLAPPWDFVFFDCPPSIGLLSLNALQAATEVLVPIDCGTLSLEGIPELRQILARMKAKLNPGLGWAGVVVGRYDGRTNISRAVLEQIRAALGPLVCRTVIRENVTLRSAPAHRQPINLFAPTSPGAIDYAALAAELEEGSKA